jgi:hypothetical protein
LLEQADLARRIARRMQRSGLVEAAARHERTAQEALRRAAVLHEVLLSTAPAATGEATAGGGDA